MYFIGQTYATHGLGIALVPPEELTKNSRAYEEWPLLLQFGSSFTDANQAPTPLNPGAYVEVRAFHNLVKHMSQLTVAKANNLPHKFIPVQQAPQAGGIAADYDFINASDSRYLESIVSEVAIISTVATAAQTNSNVMIQILKNLRCYNVTLVFLLQPPILNFKSLAS